MTAEALSSFSSLVETPMFTGELKFLDKSGDNINFTEIYLGDSP